MTATRVATAGAVLCAAAALVGCADGRSQADSGEDCSVPIVFEGRTYVWAPSQDHYVEPGPELGSGTLGACFDGDETELDPSARVVFAMPEVSAEQAIVLTDGSGGHGQVYRVADPPEGGWDPDLHVWLERAGVRIE
jgi:hypothetical protein